MSMFTPISSSRSLKPRASLASLTPAKATGESCRAARDPTTPSTRGAVSKSAPPRHRRDGRRETRAATPSTRRAASDPRRHRRDVGFRHRSLRSLESMTPDRLNNCVPPWGAPSVFVSSLDSDSPSLATNSVTRAINPTPSAQETSRAAAKAGASTHSSASCALTEWPGTALCTALVNAACWSAPASTNIAMEKTGPMEKDELSTTLPSCWAMARVTDETRPPRSGPTTLTTSWLRGRRAVKEARGRRARVASILLPARNVCRLQRCLDSRDLADISGHGGAEELVFRAATALVACIGRWCGRVVVIGARCPKAVEKQRS
ncbi:unnamed protein product, partial [Pelagomonas calceolata]